VEKIPLALHGSVPALFWGNGWKDLLSVNCDTTRYPDMGISTECEKKTS
jgi:hypothetical protein